jgi:hypothetical protein
MDDEIKVPIELPLDDDGFLRRECPVCEQQFKWYVHQDGDPDAELVEQYCCPLCGEMSGLDAWCTPDQLDYAQGAASPVLDQYVSDMMAEAFKGLKNLKFEPNRDFTLGIPAPDPIAEPNDMVIAEPPCHPNEPVKVPEASTGRLHCLICGTVYAV